MDSIFSQLAVILGFASIFGFLMKRFNLPLLVAYLLVGVLFSALTIFDFNSSAVSILPEIGIAFVLFLIGMELDFREIASFGAPILVTGITQITISAIAGVTLASLFGFGGLEAFYLGVGLSFSSTVVVVKLLIERRDLNSLYGKLAVGITLLEDLIAIIVLMFLSIRSVGAQVGLPLAILITKGAALLILSAVLSKFLLPFIFKAVSKSTELLFLTALTWCFAFIALSLALGFSVVIGAFLAGVALASSPFHYHISSRIKPLRDFFIVLFFVYLGSQVGFSAIVANLPLILIFTIYALVGKTIIFLLILGAFGFRKHTIFQSSLSLSQISEFALIILLFGERLHLVSPTAISVMAISVALSIIFSSIFIAHSKYLYPFVRPLLQFFELKNKFNRLENRVETSVSDHVVVIGANNIGRPIVEFLKKEKIPFIVLDFNPAVIEELQAENVPAIYGDLGDTEVLDNLNLGSAKLIISTISDVEDNKILLTELRRKKSSAKVVMRAEEEDDIQDLRKRGADYIILPETVSADFLVNQLEHNWPKVYFGRLNALI